MVTKPTFINKYESPHRMHPTYKHVFGEALKEQYSDESLSQSPIGPHIARFTECLHNNNFSLARDYTEQFFRKHDWGSFKDLTPTRHIRNLARIVSKDLCPSIVPYKDRFHGLLWSTREPRNIDSIYSPDETYEMVFSVYQTRSKLGQGIDLHNPTEWLPSYLFDSTTQQNYTVQAIENLDLYLADEKLQNAKIISIQTARAGFKFESSSQDAQAGQIITFPRTRYRRK